MHIEIWPLERVVPYSGNPRAISAAAIDKVAASLKEFGWQQPMVVDPEGVLVVGHTRRQAALSLGWTEGPVHVARNLTPTQIRAYRLADNRSNEEAKWDNGLLSGELEGLKLEGYDLALTAFDAEECKTLLAFQYGTVGLTDPDEAPEAPAVPVSVTGDVWILGNHRVLCGDSTSVNAVERLMNGEKADMVFTDPPYGVSANGGRSDTVRKLGMTAIANDDLRGNELQQFVIDSFSAAPLKEGGSFYVCYDQKTQYEFSAALRSVSWHQRSTIIWNKNVFGLSGFKGYRPKFELIAFGHTGKTYAWFGDNSQADVWDIPRPTERPGGHPIPKPVELIERALTNSSQAGDVVLDLFGGSGSTLIACEKTARQARLMELDPKYVDVIVNRWQKFTGKQAIHEDGTLFDERLPQPLAEAA